jgi:hypothetical protein
MADRRIFLLFFLFSICFFILGQYFSLIFVYVGSMHLAMLSLALYFLYSKDMKGFFSDLGIPGDLKKNVIYTVGGLVAVFATLFVLTITLLMFGINDQAKVADVANNLPISVLAIAIFLAPFSEELLFRGLLVTRIEQLNGNLKIPYPTFFAILFSSLIFGSLHIAYGSVVEIIGAIAIGMVLGIIFKMSKSIVPAITVHMIYNLISITVLRLFA